MSQTASAAVMPAIPLCRIGAVCGAGTVLGGTGVASRASAASGRLLCDGLAGTCLAVCGGLAGRSALSGYGRGTENRIVAVVTESVAIGICVVGAVSVCNVTGSAQTGTGPGMVTGMVILIQIGRAHV